MKSHQSLSCLFKRFLTIISPKLNTKVIYFVKFKKRINLHNPKTLDEKIQYLKLNDYFNNPLVTQCCDKYAVREYVKNCGCEEILNELYYVWDSVDEINWNDLPNQFVIKWNFGCGQNFICRNKANYSWSDVKAMLIDWANLFDYNWQEYSELQYKNIVPKLVCEKLIDTVDHLSPIDYKVYCFNGNAECVLMCFGRDESGHGAKYYFFDRKWNLKRYNKIGKEAPKNFTLPKPQGIDSLFEYAELLSKPFPFVRADFYLEGGQVIFGELTFTPCGGCDTNRLPETQNLFGDMVRLTK